MKKLGWHSPALIMFPLLLLLFPVSARAAVSSASPVDVGVDGQYFEANTANNIVMHIPLAADPNGDTLQALTIDNKIWEDPPADEPLDIAANTVRLWYVANDAAGFSTSTAQLIAVMNYNSSRGHPAWDVTGLSYWVGNGSALYVTVDITSAPSADVVCRFQTDSNMIEFVSGSFPADPELPVQPPKIYITPYFTATQLNAAHTSTSQIILSTGQTFSPLSLTMANPGTPLTAPVFLTGLTLTVRGAADEILAPDRAFDQLSIRDAFTGVVLSQVTSLPGTAEPVYLPMSVSVTAGDSRSLEIFGTVCSNSLTAVSSFRLEWSNAGHLEAQDAYIWTPVTVLPYNDSFPMQTNLFSVQLAARRLLVEHTPVIPANDVVIKGQTNVNPLNFTFRNPGTTGTARVDVARLTLAVTDTDGNTLSPDSVFSRVAIGGGILYGELSPLPSDTYLMTITLSQSYCSVNVYQPVTVCVLADIKPDASATDFRLSLPNPVAVRAQDANSLALVTVANSYDSDPFPMVSNPIRIASSLLLTSSSLAPKNLYPGQRTGMLSLTVTHPGPADLGTLVLHGLTLTARDSAGNALEWASNVSGIFLMDQGSATLAQGIPAPGQTAYYLAVPDVALGPFSTTTLRLEIQLNSAPASKTLAVGLAEREAVSVTQPADPSRPVFVAGTWPMYSAAASVGGGEGPLRLSNYPNPFAAGRQETRIAYYLENHAHVTAKLYTLAGDQVLTLCQDALQLSGENQLVWNGRTSSGAVVVNGVYLLRLETAPVSAGEAVVQIRKIAVVK